MLLTGKRVGEVFGGILTYQNLILLKGLNYG